MPMLTMLPASLRLETLSTFGEYSPSICRTDAYTSLCVSPLGTRPRISPENIAIALTILHEHNGQPRNVATLVSHVKLKDSPIVGHRKVSIDVSGSLVPPLDFKLGGAVVAVQVLDDFHEINLMPLTTSVKGIG